MKNCIRAVLFCLLLTLTGCQQTQLTIANGTGEGFYLIDARTIRNITAEKIEKFEKAGEIRRISQSTTEYTYDDKNSGSTAFEKYRAGNRYVFCFVSDSALRKAKENGTEPEYLAIPTDENIDFSYIIIRITHLKGKPSFEIETMQ